MVPVSVVIAVLGLVLGLIPFEVAKIDAFIVRPHSLARGIVETFIFRLRDAFEVFAVTCMRELEAVEPTVLQRCVSQMLHL